MKSTHQSSIQWLERILSMVLDQDATHKSTAALLKRSPEIVWGLTGIYFVYVVLGGVHHGLHKHIYTGDENESLFKRISRGKPVCLSADVYDEFFSFKHYFTTYRIHVLTAGAWLVSGAYNLRNTPQFIGKDATTGHMQFEGWWHRRASGYTYVLTSFIKGLTASVISYRSRSLGFARYPMVCFGVYDCISLVVAMQKLYAGDIQGHKRWMIRNFGIGAGSIWVRVFAGAWAAFDMSFVRNPDLYRKITDVCLTVGFVQGFLFTEWWVSAGNVTKQRCFALLQALNVCMYLIGARRVYRQLREEANRGWNDTGVNSEFGLC